MTAAIARSTEAAPAPGPLVTCSACLHEFRAAVEMLGKEMPCPHCNGTVQVPKKIDTSPVNKDPLIGQKLAGCTLTRRLGAGGIGLVYEGIQSGTNRKVALKLLGAKAGADRVLVERFRREAQLQASIDHPHIVKAFAAGEERGAHYLIMELVDHGTLASVTDQGRLPWAEACILIAQTARALELLHDQGIIHRDMKPANILLGRGRDGRRVAKLADLGLAKEIDEVTESGMSLTLEGKPLGTPAYMAPEQIRDAKSAGRPADVYGLGTTLYTCLSGRRPYEGTSPMAVMGAVLKGPPPDLKASFPDIPGQVLEILRSALHADVKRRPTALSLATQLEAAVAGASSAAWRRPTAGSNNAPALTPAAGAARPITEAIARQPGTRPIAGVQRSKHDSAVWSDKNTGRAAPSWAIWVIITLLLTMVCLLTYMVAY